MSLKANGVFHCTPNEILKQGYLTKRGQRIKTWRYRYFLLTHAFLAYFRCASDEQPAGVIPLEKVKEFGRCVDKEKLRKEVKKKFCLYCETESRTYFFFGNDEANSAEWLEALEKARDALNEVPSLPAIEETENDVDDGTTVDQYGTMVAKNPRKVENKVLTFLEVLEKHEKDPHYLETLSKERLEELLKEMEEQYQRDVQSVLERYDAQHTYFQDQIALLEAEDEEGREGGGSQGPVTETSDTSSSEDESP
eukprot:GCRY01001219.1.p1 GENE.GCRY01001219.1~~GCRY01001219.1.p1  ORF type:complete len:252 (+),score=33.63 GCRY01001219.1:200-955(+)